MALVERRLCPEKAPRLVIHSPRLRRRKQNTHSSSLLSPARARPKLALRRENETSPDEARSRARRRDPHLRETRRHVDAAPRRGVREHAGAAWNSRASLDSALRDQMRGSRDLHERSSIPCVATAARNCSWCAARPSPVRPTKVREQSVPKPSDRFSVSGGSIRVPPTLDGSVETDVCCFFSCRRDIYVLAHQNQEDAQWFWLLMCDHSSQQSPQ